MPRWRNDSAPSFEPKDFPQQFIFLSVLSIEAVADKPWIGDASYVGALTTVRTAKLRNIGLGDQSIEISFYKKRVHE
jgi:hypothetical protein